MKRAPCRRVGLPTALPVAALVATLVATLGPARAAEPTDDWFGADKKLHFQASAALALVGYGGTALFTHDRGMRAGVAVAFAIDMGIAKELWDRAGHGDPSSRDLVWDVAGTATGLAVAVAVDWAIQHLF
jgi:putative lipoprotein